VTACEEARAVAEAAGDTHLARQHANQAAHMLLTVADLLVTQENDEGSDRESDGTRLEEAAAWYRLSCDAADAAFGAGSPDSATARRRFGRLLRGLGRDDEAHALDEEGRQQQDDGEQAHAPSTAQRDTRVRALEVQFAAAAQLASSATT
jgi:hypothetical protein